MNDWSDVATAGGVWDAGRRNAAERRSNKRFHNPERRSGFDRRRRYLFTGALRDNPLTLVGVLFIVNMLSALDFVFTYIQLQFALITEGNPVMAELFAQGPGQAWLFKTGAMLVVTAAIWRGREHRAVLGVALAALFLYLSVIGWHIVGMALFSM